MKKTDTPIIEKRTTGKSISTKMTALIVLIFVLESILLFFILSAHIKSQYIDDKKQGIQSQLIGLQENIGFLAANNEARQIQKAISLLAADRTKKSAILIDNKAKIIASTRRELINMNIDDLKVINIHELIQNLSESIGIRIMEKSGVLNMDLKASKAEVLADEFHLTNTMYNVLDNAEKYSKSHPEISIITHNEKDGLLISIRDAGIGIKEDFQKYVFDKFFRVPTGDVHNVKGFGLGLSYVKTIIEAHRGTVSLQSKLNIGSQFDIYLPFK